MDVLLCMLGVVLNLSIFMCIRKNRHHENFLQMLGMGITFICSMYLVFNQVIFWITKKDEPALAGIMLLLTASICLFMGAFHKIKFQKYYVGRQELMFAITTVILLVGLIFYRKLYSSVDGLLRAFLWVSAGSLFLSLMIDKIKKNSARVVGFVMSLFFMLGYPLANVLCGNMVLAVAMNYVLIDLILIRMYKRRHLNEGTSSILLLLEGLFFAICYPAGFGIFVVMILPLLSMKYRRSSAAWVLALVLVPALAAVLNVLFVYGSWSNYYTYYYEHHRAVFINSWSDIGFMIFPILLYIYYRIDRRKHLGQIYWPVAGVVMYGIIMAAAGWFGHNSYDGFNQLYLLWVLFMYIGVTGLLDTFEEFRSFLVAYVCTIMAVFCLMLTGVEETLQNENVWYCVEVKADAYLKVYDWNWKALRNNSIPALMQELIDYCDGLRAGNPDILIPCMITDSEYRIESFYRQTGQEDSFRYMYMLQKKLLDARQEQQKVWDEDILARYDNIPYVMVERNCKLYWYGIGIYGQLEPIYENEYGFIYKLQ